MLMGGQFFCANPKCRVDKPPGMRYNLSCVCGRSSSGRARPCQGRGSEFEPRRPLQKENHSFGVVFFFVSDGPISFSSERNGGKNATKTYGFGFPWRDIHFAKSFLLTTRDRRTCCRADKRTVSAFTGAEASRPLDSATVEHIAPTVAVGSVSEAAAESCPGTVLLTDNDNERPCPREYLPHKGRP